MPAFVKNTRRETFVGIVFALSLVIMPWVYELLWYAHPDYFRVQAGVNVLPTELYSIAGEYSAYADGPPLPPMTLQSEQDDAANKILSTYRQFQTTSVMLSTKRVELKKRQVGVQDSASFTRQAAPRSASRSTAPPVAKSPSKWQETASLAARPRDSRI